MVNINKELIETQKQTFELNIQLALNQLKSEIEKQKADFLRWICALSFWLNYQINGLWAGRYC